MFGNIEQIIQRISKSQARQPLTVASVLACTVVLFVGAAPQISSAESAYDPEDKVYATGAMFETEEELADKTRTPLYRNFVPLFVDLSDRFPKPRNQGAQSSCVAWAVGYAVRSYYNSAPGRGSRLRAHQIPSPAYIYDTIRWPNPSCNLGTQISDALDLLKKGVISHAEYPYDDRLCRLPRPSQLTLTSKFRIVDWVVVNTRILDQVKAELANGHPVIVGMRPNQEFYQLRGQKVWHAGVPKIDDGHHAIAIVGYFELGQYFLIMNSWGTGWGDGGFGRISYDTFRRRVKRGFSMRVEETPIPKIPEPTPPSIVVPELKLPTIGCGRLTIKKRNGRQVVVGFVGKRDDLMRVRQAAEQAKALVEVDYRPWPQCEALMTLEQPLAVSTKPSIGLPKHVYRESETLQFEISMASFPGYLYVAYIQADGSVVNLVQSDPLTLSTLQAHDRLTFGDGHEGRSKFTVAPPFGNEMIVAIASMSPLFAEERPLVETEREFLTALRKAIIARPDPTLPERVVSANFVVLETKAEE